MILVLNIRKVWSNPARAGAHKNHLQKYPNEGRTGLTRSGVKIRVLSSFPCMLVPACRETRILYKKAIHNIHHS